MVLAESNALSSCYVCMIKMQYPACGLHAKASSTRLHNFDGTPILQPLKVWCIPQNLLAVSSVLYTCMQDEKQCRVVIDSAAQRGATHNNSTKITLASHGGQTAPTFWAVALQARGRHSCPRCTASPCFLAAGSRAAAAGARVRGRWPAHAARQTLPSLGLVLALLAGRTRALAVLGWIMMAWQC